jgi:hypothetical protein
VARIEINHVGAVMKGRRSEDGVGAVVVIGLMVVLMGCGRSKVVDSSGGAGGAGGSTGFGGMGGPGDIGGAAGFDATGGASSGGGGAGRLGGSSGAGGAASGGATGGGGGGVGGGAGGASMAPYATTIRLTVGGTKMFFLDFGTQFNCPVGYSIRGVAAATLPPMPVYLPQDSCDCSPCANGPTPIECQPTDPISNPACDVSGIQLSPGSRYERIWDGTVQTWFDPTPGGKCQVSCSTSSVVPAGTYVFSLVQLDGTIFDSAPTTLPTAGGSVEIPVSASP